MGRLRFIYFCFLLTKLIRGSWGASTTDSTLHHDDVRYHQSRHTNEGRRPCDTEQLEYRLTKLEVQVDEKSERVASELREGNRRLQALEYQNSEVQTALEAFRNELGRFTESSHPLKLQQATDQQQANEKFEVRIDNLIKGVHLVVAALRGLNSDMAWMKKNISAIVNVTSNLLLQYENLATKHFLSNSLLEMKHEHSFPPIPSHIFTVPNSTISPSGIPRNCKDILESGIKSSGIYTIQPVHSLKPFMVLCDMDTKEGGWTYIHNRYEGAQDFFLGWHDYKVGFGNIGGEFWLGLEHIYQLTGHEINELLIELLDMNSQKAYAHYAAFSIGSEMEGFALKVLGGYSGDAGDSLIYHAGSRFSAKDLDQDGWVEGNCAQAHNGAWWYRGCDTSNLNGKYLNGELPESYLYQGMYWGEFRGAQYSLKQSRMMVRPRGKDSPSVFPVGIEGNRKG